MNLFQFLIFLLLLFLTFSCKSPSTISGNSAPGTKKIKISSYKSSEKINKVIETARSYIGTGYKYGGTTKAGMDCSGLVWVSYKAADIELPRTSAQLKETGKKVNIANIKPGDIVFFSARKNSKKITHVGIVTEVRDKNNVKFIHASTSRGVIEAGLFAKYWLEIFVKAIRPY